MVPGDVAAHVFPYHRDRLAAIVYWTQKFREQRETWLAISFHISLTMRVLRESPSA
ncbi:protein of unknown function [Candidatus Filomicrobium marinum]|uniref:Uncharacterized protein n=1 Tax=Candidatus Filomicrobium marinum TaxID=1608628 RepID=A0A0D6JKQ5_9HYPH|nr:protein of unknown function [Candidatus Filomicrobium marinum]